MIEMKQNKWCTTCLVKSCHSLSDRGPVCCFLWPPWPLLTADLTICVAVEKNHCSPLTEQGAHQQIDAGASTQRGGEQLNTTGHQPITSDHEQHRGCNNSERTHISCISFQQDKNSSVHEQGHQIVDKKGQCTNGINSIKVSLTWMFY